MKTKTLLFIAPLLLLACNLPSLLQIKPTAVPPPIPTVVTMTPTQAAKTPKPTKTPKLTPDVETQSPVDFPPTTGALPTAANSTPIVITQPALPTAAPFTDTPFVPTPGDPTPISRGTFQGTFTGGTLSFRINEKSTVVIPKAVILKGAKCKEGQSVSTSFAFEPPPSFDIESASFTFIDDSNQLTVTGRFLSPVRAAGAITFHLKVKNQPCTIGPLPWIANGS